MFRLIELALIDGGTVWVNPFQITTARRYYSLNDKKDPYTRLKVEGDEQHFVKEAPEEINELIECAKI